MAHGKISKEERKRRTDKARAEVKKPRSQKKAERKAKKKKRRARQESDAATADAQLAVDRETKTARKEKISVRQKTLIAQKRAGADIDINAIIREEFGTGRGADAGALPDLIGPTQAPQGNSGSGVGPENAANQAAVVGSVPGAPADRREPQAPSGFNFLTHDVRSVPGFENLTPETQEQMIAMQRQILGGPISEAGLIGSVPGEPASGQAPAKLNVPETATADGPGPTPSVPGGVEPPPVAPTAAPAQAVPGDLDPDERDVGFPPPTEPLGPESGLRDVLGGLLAESGLGSDVIDGVTGLLEGLTQVQGATPLNSIFNSDLGLFEIAGSLGTKKVPASPAEEAAAIQWVKDANRALVGASLAEKIALDLLAQTGRIDQLTLRNQFDIEMLELTDTSQQGLLKFKFENDLKVLEAKNAREDVLLEDAVTRDIENQARQFGFTSALQNMDNQARKFLETEINAGRINLAEIQSDLDFDRVVKTLQAEISAKLKLDESLEAQQIIDVPQGGAFTAADGSFDQVAADKARVDFIPQMRSFIDRARQSGDILQLEEGISLLRQQFPLPPEIVWDGKSFSNRAGLEGRNRTPEVEEYLRLAQDAYSQMTTARNAITAQLDINNTIQLEQGLASIAEQKLRRALDDDDITTAEEQDIIESRARTRVLDLEATLKPINMLLELTANPVRLAMAQRFGILDQIKNAFNDAGLNFEMPDFFSNMNIQTGSVPSVNDFTRMTEAERVAIMAEWISENGGTPQDFFQAFQGNLPSNVRGSTQVTSF